MTNESNKKPIWLSQHNKVNINQLLNDKRRCGYLDYVWDGNEYGEKGIQLVKNEFMTKKGKFTANTMEKLHSKKI